MRKIVKKYFVFNRYILRLIDFFFFSLLIKCIFAKILKFSFLSRNGISKIEYKNTQKKICRIIRTK